MLSIQNVCVLSLTSVSVYPSLLHYFCVCVVSGNTHTARVCVRVRTFPSLSFPSWHNRGHTGHIFQG